MFEMLFDEGTMCNQENALMLEDHLEDKRFATQDSIIPPIAYYLDTRSSTSVSYVSIEHG